MAVNRSDLKCKTFDAKPEAIKTLIIQALEILSAFGVPLAGQTARSLERMGMAFLAVCDINQTNSWDHAKDLNNERSMKSRDIINYWNEHYNENISSGSYDDIRRKDLDLILLSEIVVRSKPDTATNDPSRGYALNPEYSTFVRQYRRPSWEEEVEAFMSRTIPLAERIRQRREIPRVQVQIPDGTIQELSLGGHNDLQKAIIEEFLSRYGHGAQVLYLGDTAKKQIIYNKERLQELGFFTLEHEELPDIVAYSEEQNWIFVIEAVYSCNPVTPARKIKIDALTANCTAGIVYVSAFLDRKAFNSFLSEIAWETEVWIADEPDHLIHFNGHRFLGPYER